MPVKVEPLPISTAVAFARALTVTVHVAVSPLSEIAVITAVPTETSSSLPSA